ncbi:MAG: histidine ammonia-lyase [Candidatus Wallbacteria bacterium]|nr:histidine ammonia-lyase [Candidatus Wallbacteria bacterium]
MTQALDLDGQSLDIASVHRVATDPSVRVRLSEGARESCARSRLRVEAYLASGEPVYGVNTGFGDLARVCIPQKDLEQLQLNLILSHAVGAGEPLPEDVVRGVLLLRANTLARGASGVRPELIDSLLALLNAGVVPVIPAKGSLGASGDLAPLAHMSLVLVGQGEATYRGRRMPGAEALEAAGLEPVKLAAKEGLSLINGTPVMTSIACMALVEALALQKSAAIAATLSTEALHGSDTSFDAEIQQLRPHPGQAEIAAYVRALMRASEIRQSHIGCDKVQDSYSIRCIPQVHGAVLDAWEYARRVVAIEINSVTDNPILTSDKVVPGGNFHGEPVGFAMDLLAIAMSELGAISERRTFRLLTTSLSHLPPFLVRESGLNSGLMIAQYTAAALASENKVLCHPATVDSIPTSADQEDHVSMATTAARKAHQVIRHTATILAIEMLTACQGLEFQDGMKPGTGSLLAYRRLRERVPALEGDRDMRGDLAAAERLVLDGALGVEMDRCLGFDWQVLRL